MSLVTASIRIAAAPAEVWKTVMDPACLGEWVTIHRKLVHADGGPPRVGYTMDQQIHMRGVSLEVHWSSWSAGQASSRCGRVAALHDRMHAANTSSNRRMRARALTTATNSALH